MWLFEQSSVYVFTTCLYKCCVSFSMQGPWKALCQCSCRHLNRHETHFQWDSNHFFRSQQRAELQCQPSAISTRIRFLAQHWQALRISWGPSSPRVAQQASNKWSSGQHRLSYCEGLWQLNRKKVSDRSWEPITNHVTDTGCPYVLDYTLPCLRLWRGFAGERRQPGLCDADDKHGGKKAGHRPYTDHRPAGESKIQMY